MIIQIIRIFRFFPDFQVDPDIPVYPEFQISGFSCLPRISNFWTFQFIQILHFTRNFKFPDFLVYPEFQVYPDLQVNPKPRIERVSGLKAKSVGPSGLFRPKPVSPAFR
jgi:hypothetical protein